MKDEIFRIIVYSEFNNNKDDFGRPAIKISVKESGKLLDTVAIIHAFRRIAQLLYTALAKNCSSDEEVKERLQAFLDGACEKARKEYAKRWESL